LLVQGSLVGSEESKRVSKALCESREQGFQIIRSVLERGVKARELPHSTDIDALAQFFNAVSHGISVQAVSGIPTETLHHTITIAMRSWPEVQSWKPLLSRTRRRASSVQKSVKRTK
jgi:hypothetical protein